MKKLKNILRKKKMVSKKKRKNIPYHIAHNYKHYELSNGIVKFWAQNESDAKLYCDKIKWSPLSLKEISE
tara:strand:+ start:230 stop:439 length:210 start_codon:yes stop_codon:yes gene_type:complete